MATALSGLYESFTANRSIFQQEQLNELEEQGLIKAFEYTYELSRYTLRVICRIKGIPNTTDHAILSERLLISG